MTDDVQSGGQRARLEPASRAREGMSGRAFGLVLVAGAVVAFTVTAIVFRSGGSSGPTAWSRLGTEDVHSLTFLGDDPTRLLFGHHGGLSSSIDGGRTWQPLPASSDAMSLGAASDGSLVIAGHDVFAVSRDGGRSWEQIAAKLPTLDIHGFARDPSQPGLMWAYPATGGLWQSDDGGVAWRQIQAQNILFPVAARSAAGIRLFGVTVDGLASSDDGGRTWRTIGNPGLYPIISLTATSDGSVLLAGGLDGLVRSTDAGATWAKLPLGGEPAAVAVTAGGSTIAVVDRSTDFFRSDDGGLTWPGR